MRNHKLIRLFGTGFIAVSLVCSSCAPAGSSAEKSTAATAATSTVSEETTTTEGETEGIKETGTGKETKETTEGSTEKATTEVTTGAKETEEPTAEDTSADADTKGEAEETTEEDTAPETTEETVPETTTEEEPTTPEPTAPPETTPEPTTPAPTTPKETTPAPTTPKPTETTPAPTTQPIVIVKAVKIEGTVSGTHYIGDTLSASDFTIKVTMSDGNVLTNPAGFAVAPLTLSAATNTLTIAYGDISGTMTVTATERPQPTQPSQGQGTGQNVTYRGEDILWAALSCLNLPYKLGGTTTAGFDCSGFVAYCYKQVGVTIPTSTTGQKTCGVKYDMWHAKPGDIVVTEADGWIHTAIYFGSGLVIEARDGQGVDVNVIATDMSVDDSKTGRKIYAIRPGNNTTEPTNATYNGKVGTYTPEEVAEYGLTLVGDEYYAIGGRTEYGITVHNLLSHFAESRGVYGTDFSLYGLEINGKKYLYDYFIYAKASTSAWIYRFEPYTEEWDKNDKTLTNKSMFINIW